MLKAERSAYCPQDLLDWRSVDGLVLSPKFQRRGVWKLPAKSYLIDTLIRGMPVPPIYLRKTQNKAKNKVIREVIDGQQRISAVLSYIDGEFPISKNIASEFSGKRFDQLDKAQRDAILDYSFICEVFAGIDDAEVLEVFARLNTYSVALNSQELRNGKFFGQFKSSAYLLAHEHLEYWRSASIFSEQKIARMLEVEFVSELMVLMLDGLQDKKASIDGFYDKYDEKFPLRAQVEDRFRKVMDLISMAVSEEISSTEFRRSPVFYSLFSAVYHRMYGLKDVSISRASGKITKDEIASIRDAVISLSDRITAVKEGGAKGGAARVDAFVEACLRQTDNIAPRRVRLKEIYRLAFD